ncbi:MAG: tannase/feruloyl esterase family alpha/beta hydrolase [Steroidobacteraceae bacterium]
MFLLPAVLGLPLIVAPISSAAEDLQSSVADGAQRCDRLQQIMRGHWPDSSTHVLEAHWRANGFPLAARFGPPSRLPAHCELTGIMQQRAGIDGERYAIRFRVRLPEHWNGRFFFEGGGGSEGVLGPAIGVVEAGTPNALARGFAIVSEDSGHDNASDSNPARGGAVAFGFDPQARANYGGTSLKPVADAAKMLIRAYYDHPIVRSYFYGCSKGGQEGMVLAQRYPDEFDGIVAADPGFSLPRAAVAEAWDTQGFASLIAHSKGKDPDPGQLPTTFTTAQFQQVRDAILAACDADDGLRDGITSAFEHCTWRKVAVELRRATCGRERAQAGEPGGKASCLTAGQIGVLGRVLGGPRDGRGRALYSDWPIDAGIGSPAWRSWKIGPAKGTFPGINVALGAPALAEIFTTPPTAVRADVPSALRYALGFNFDHDAPRIYATGGPFHRSAWTDIAARSAHLERFRDHGGKLIVPQGASDPVFSLNDTLNWYRQVQAIERGKAADFVRIFAVPGMAHCAGGPATDEFDALGPLIAWVEQGVPPDRILAKAGAGTPWPGRTRPLCPYPKIPRYAGTGSIEDAANFRCE